MKKFFDLTIAGIAAVTFAACSSDHVVDNSVQKGTAANQPIGFSVSQKNITRASKLEDKGFINFGVWAYKYSGTPSGNAEQNVMNHYLVGYSSGDDNNKKGYNYKYDGVNSTSTFGSSSMNTDGKSLWFYEGLGSTQYTGGGGGWEASSISTNTSQHITYWDKGYDNTNFYAYTPYKASDINLHITESGTATLTLPAGTLVAGMKDNARLSVFDSDDPVMYAGHKSANVDKLDVPLSFKHLGTRVRLAFYSKIHGYKVKLKNLGYESTTGAPHPGVQATPAVKNPEGSTSAYSTGYYVYQIASNKILFAADASNATLDTPAATDKHQDNLVFPIVVGGATAELLIADRDVDPSAPITYLPQYYWAIPQNLDADNTGFTFHVTFDIISNTTNEVTTVHNAKVHVPKEYFNWKDGYQYTYVFKIDHGVNGDTAPDAETEYVSPNPDTDNALKPIVFDNIEIDEWTETQDVNGEGNPDEFEIK